MDINSESGRAHPESGHPALQLQGRQPQTRQGQRSLPRSLPTQATHQTPRSSQHPLDVGHAVLLAGGCAPDGRCVVQGGQNCPHNQLPYNLGVGPPVHPTHSPDDVESPPCLVACLLDVVGPPEFGIDDYSKVLHCRFWCESVATKLEGWLWPSRGWP